MTTPETLAGMLLSRVEHEGPVADLLWQRAGENVGTAGVAPSAELTLSLASGPIEVAERLASVSTDAAVLSQLARKDSRKRVRLAVAKNPAADVATLEYLLAWALRASVQHEPTAAAVLGRASDLGWDSVRTLVAAGGAHLPGSEHSRPSRLWWNVASCALAGGDSAVRDALSLRWGSLTEELVKNLGRTPEGVTLTLDDVLAAQDDPGQRRVVAQLVESTYRRLDTPLVTWLVRLLPEWPQFPLHHFVSSHRPSTHRTVDAEAVELLVANARSSTGEVTDTILASCRGVPTSDRLSLLTRRPALAGLVASMEDLDEEVQLALLALAPPPGPAPKYGSTPNPASVLAARGRPVSPAVAEALLEYFAREQTYCDLATLLRTAFNASSEAKLRLLRKRGSWATTERWLAANDGGPQPGDVKALVSDPGVAFSHTVASGYPYKQVTPRTPAEITAFVLEKRSTFLKEPFASEVLDLLPGILRSGLDTRLLDYLLLRLGPLAESPAAMDLLLTFSTEWEGTVPELVEMIQASVK